MSLALLNQVARILAVIILVDLRPCIAADESKPIVDVRFDAPYQQIESSDGDEWAPTWGRDDILYTGNDDGSSFNGISTNGTPTNAMAFGKLVGNDPYELKGISLNAMRDFSESPRPGPEGANWKILGSYTTEGASYRFVPCGPNSARLTYSCLASSTDEGKTWVRTEAVGSSIFPGTELSTPSFISFRPDLEAYLSGDKVNDFVYAASYSGLVDGEDRYVVARVAKQRLPRGNPADWSYLDSSWDWHGEPERSSPQANSYFLGPDNANWKTTNTYSVDGVLYMFVMRCHYPWQSGDPKRRHIFRDSSIIKSTDNGRSWSRPAADNYSKPMFPGRRFGTPYFVWYGKDGAARVDNADRYVYAISNNGYFEAGDDYVLGRVLKAKLPNLSSADWSFYRSGDGMDDGSWTDTLDAATPVLKNPGQSSMTGMTYIAGLRRYLMVVWHFRSVSFATAILDKDLSTTLEFFEAPKPWGPWVKVKTYNTRQLGWYTPIVGQRFQTVADSATVKGFLYATGLTSKPEGGLDPTLYKLNYMPITLSIRALHHKDLDFVGAR